MRSEQDNRGGRDIRVSSDGEVPPGEPGRIERENPEEDTIHRHYVSLYQSAPFPYLVLDEKGIITRINDLVPRFLSERPERIPGQSLRSFVTKDDHEIFDAFLNGILVTGERQSCEIVLKSRQKNGEKTRCTGTVYQDPAGSSHEWFIVLTECNPVEPPEIREKYQKTAFLSYLIEHTSHPFAVAYPNGQIRICNTSFEALLGYTSEELASLDWARDLTPDEWKEFELERLRELLRTGHPVSYEKEYIRKDGTRIPVELYVHLVTDAGGTPQYYYSFISDISERKSAELKLRENEERFRQLAENVEQIFWFTTLDPEQVTYVNPSFERIWGVRAEELYKDPRIWTGCILPEDKNRVIKAFTSWIKGKTSRYDVEFRIRNKQGGIRLIHDRGAAIIRKGGAPVQVSGIAEDITDRKPRDDSKTSVSPSS
ncbi:MAG: PAS domain S-box protein [Methanospirillum sp.]|nr:PAS domain S-box protein [Methanospirillum sp.]